MPKTFAAITGVNAFLPNYVLTNDELSQMVETTDDWIKERTGISERRILKGKGLATSDMGAEAVRGLLAKKNLQPTDIDLLICATVTPDMVFPATANIICDKAGIKNNISFDIAAACSGFVFSLVTASQFIESGRVKRAIVVGADKMSSIANYQDRTTCILFGDAAAAVLLEACDETENIGLIDSILKTDGSGRVALHQKAGGSLNPPNFDTVLDSEHYVYQDVQTVFKFAVKNMAAVAYDIMERNGLSGEDVTWLVPHQANKRIIDATRERMGLPEEKVMINVGSVGQPRDGNPQASYVILDGPKVTFRRVPYPFELTAAKVHAIPELDSFLGDRLQEGR